MTAGAEHDELDAAAGDCGGGERARRRDVRELLQADVGNAPLADAGAADDPIVAGVEQAREIVIAEHRRRQALAPAGDGRVDHSHAPLMLERIAGRAAMLAFYWIADEAYAAAGGGLASGA